MGVMVHLALRIPAMSVGFREKEPKSVYQFPRYRAQGCLTSPAVHGLIFRGPVRAAEEDEGQSSTLFRGVLGPVEVLSGRMPSLAGEGEPYRFPDTPVGGKGGLR